jgi:hypothetical protein
MAANGSSREFEEGIVAHEVLGGYVPTKEVWRAV